jgi:RimJ/RimL family protein N-acetyltransferase
VNSELEVVGMSRVIETARLVLRPWQVSDADAALAIYADPAVRRWSAPADLPVTAGEMRLRLQHWRTDDLTSNGCTGHWAVADRSTSVVVGAMVLDHAPGSESLTIGWALAAGARGRGYATEAGDALVRWAIHEGGAVEVFALVEPDNVRARSTAERIGMEWVTELGHLDGGGRYQVYRIRHGDLDYEDEA